MGLVLLLVCGKATILPTYALDMVSMRILEPRFCSYAVHMCSGGGRGEAAVGREVGRGVEPFSMSAQCASHFMLASLRKLIADKY